MKNVLELLKSALKAEKDALYKYLKFARDTKNMSGKDMFIRLAMDEFGHAEIIQKELDHYGECGETVKTEIGSSDIEKLLPHISSALIKGRGDTGLSDLDALRVALDLENDAIKTYGEIYEKAEDTNIKEIAKRLLEMEEAHAELIQAEIDNIKRTGFWFDFEEISLEK